MSSFDSWLAHQSLRPAESMRTAGALHGPPGADTCPVGLGPGAALVDGCPLPPLPTLPVFHSSAAF